MADEKVFCRKCEKEIQINAMKKCYWCPDCRLRDKAVGEDDVVESQGGMTVRMVKDICQKMIDQQLGPKTQLTGLTDEIEKDLKEPETPDDVRDDWRKQAKELGIPTNQASGGARKKKDIIADIQDRLNGNSNVDDPDKSPVE